MRHWLAGHHPSTQAELAEMIDMQMNAALHILQLAGRCSLAGTMLLTKHIQPMSILSDWLPLSQTESHTRWLATPQQTSCGC